MIADVYIIRKDMNKFFVLDPETDNWEWSSDLEEATIFSTPGAAELIIPQRKLGTDAYVYQLPYAIVQPQQRKKKMSKKPKRTIKGKVIRKGKPSKRK
jgi:hypothetical protein